MNPPLGFHPPMSGAGGPVPPPPATPRARYAPAFPPGQMRVNESTLSGNVVKIGSP
jgi:hypothetical protein